MTYILSRSIFFDMNSSIKITSGPIIKPLVLFFFPILFGTFFQQLYNTVDALIVGNILGKDALAAVGGTTGTYVNLYVGFIVGLASGATVLISRYFGSNDYNGVSRTVHTSVAFSLLVGALFMVVGIATSSFALTSLGVPESILAMSITYTNIYFVGLVPSLVYNVGCSILRAVGDSKHPLYYLIVASIINTVLDILFITTFEMGVAGAAIATLIAQIASAILVILSLIKSQDALHLNIKDIKLDKDIVMDIIKIGFPAGIQSVLYSISNLVISAAVNRFDVDAISAFTAFGKVDQLYWQTVGALGIAITTFVGQNHGAGEIGRVKKGINRWLFTSMVITVAITAVVLQFAATLISIFNSDASVIAIGTSITLAIAPFWFCYTPVEIIAGALRGLGNSFVPTVITACGIVGVRLVWVLFIADESSITHILLTYGISWGITGTFFMIYYYAYYRKRITCLGDC